MALTPLDFPPSPTVGTLYPDPPVTGQPTYRWDGAQWLSYAAASLPTPTKPANYGKKNYIINGAMQVSQENGATAVTASGAYPVDQFSAVNLSSGAFSAAQIIAYTSSGSIGRLRFTVTTADAAVAAADLAAIEHRIEGYRVADLKFGTATPSQITIQFGVKAPAGTYCVALRNHTLARSYVAEYVIAAGEANTDVIKSVTLTGDGAAGAGFWVTNNGFAFDLVWTLMSGVTNNTTPGAWVGGNFAGTSNQFNFMGTNGNVFELFDVSLTEGTVAPPFQVPDYASELALCQRYFYPTGTSNPKGGVVGTLAGVTATASIITGTWRTTCTMRAIPTATLWNNGVQNQVRVTSAGSIASPVSITINCSPSGASSWVTGSALSVGTWLDFDMIFNARL